MTDHVTAGQVRPGDAPGALRILALVAVGVGLAALAGAAFVLSYAGIHAFAQQAGISPRLARGYPLIFDVLLVIILAAVLALRGAGLPSKVLAWTCLVALLIAAAGADAMHAAGRKLPHQSAAVTAAVVPWVLVLVALALLLAMLRHARQRRLDEAQAGPRWRPQERPPRSMAPLVPGFDWAPAVAAPEQVSAPVPAAQEDTLRRPGPRRTGPRQTVPRLTVPRQVTAATAAETDPAEAGDSAEADPAEMGAAEDSWTEDDPADLDARGESSPVADAKTQGEAENRGHEPVAVAAAARTEAREDKDAGTDPEMPVFHRMWSAPTPPGEPDE
jgi:hypothetical protein